MSHLQPSVSQNHPSFITKRLQNKIKDTALLNSHKNKTFAQKQLKIISISMYLAIGAHTLTIAQHTPWHEHHIPIKHYTNTKYG